MTDPDLFFVFSLFWAPTLLATGLGILLSPGAYERVYRDLARQPLAVLVTGLLALNLGMIQVLAFQEWGTPLGIVMSLLGWALLLKGILLVIVPDRVERMAGWWAGRKLVPVSGAVLVVLGAYLGYLAMTSWLAG